MILGQYIVEGHNGTLQCYECKAEDKEKCHFSRSDTGGDEDDDSWFGRKVNCSTTDTHCMTARTRM